MLKRLRVATRKSRLAVAQTTWVVDALRRREPGLEVDLIEIQSGGDRDRTTPLTKMPEIGAFTKALQDALLDGRADLAVHSLKDLPTSEPEGLVLAAIPERADWRDVVVTRAREGLRGLSAGATVGTGSPRRRMQLLAHRPDLEVVELRGNVDTRIRRVEEGAVDAAILAGAGLARLGLAHLADEALDFVPAPGQGALALECPAGDEETGALAAGLDHAETSLSVTAERAWLAATGAGCRTSAGALATVDGDALTLVWYYDGRSGSETAGVDDPTGLGARCAEGVR